MNAPFRHYLNPDITIRMMYNNFIEKQKSCDARLCNYVPYDNVFQSENIGFSHPSVDDCERCVQYNDHINEINGAPHDPSICVICINHFKHKEKYDQARIEYQKPKEPHIPHFTVDMQKVLVLPKLKTQEHHFVSRLITFKETFAMMTLELFPTYCILWHEAICGRTASDVTSSFLRFIQEVCIPDMQLVIWADTCSGQNKNWFLFTALVQCVNTWGPRLVELKYLERGHTSWRLIAYMVRLGSS